MWYWCGRVPLVWILFLIILLYSEFDLYILYPIKVVCMFMLLGVLVLFLFFLMFLVFFLLCSMGGHNLDITYITSSFCAIVFCLCRYLLFLLIKYLECVCKFVELFILEVYIIVFFFFVARYCIAIWEVVSQLYI